MYAKQTETIMKIIALLLLLIPAISTAQYEYNENQQALWDAMANSAPSYEMLLACNRNYTANLVYENVVKLAATMVQNDRDIQITMNMWREARAQASMQYYGTISQLANNPEGDLCNNLETRVIRILGEGV